MQLQPFVHIAKDTRKVKISNFSTYPKRQEAGRDLQGPSENPEHMTMAIHPQNNSPHIASIRHSTRRPINIVPMQAKLIQVQ